MEDRNNFRKYGDIRVCFETAEERQRAFEILESRGFSIPERLKDPASFAPRGTPGATNLLDINIRWKKLNYIPPAFICACMGSSGVRLYSVQELERIAELQYKTVPRFPLFHIPHDGWKFPPELMESVCVPENVFRDYHERMRDKDIKQLIPWNYCGGQMLCSFDVSRLLCDVERLVGPDEIMAQFGMGFCYEKAFDGTVIKKVTEALKRRTRILYDEHHDRMNQLCERHPRLLLFDLHSYSDEIVPRAFVRAGEDLPDLCIGTDPKFTPPQLAAICKNRFAEAGLVIRENYPYSGCYIPESVADGTSECDCAGIMLEFHRRSYCNEAGDTDPEKIERIRAVFRNIMADCVSLP